MLIESIIKILGAKNIKDVSFSRQLGVDPSTWSLIKSGKRQPGHKFLFALSREYPELDYDIMQYMKESAASKEVK